MKKLLVFTIDFEYIAVKDAKTLRLNVLELNALVLNSYDVDIHIGIRILVIELWIYKCISVYIEYLVVY